MALKAQTKAVFGVYLTLHLGQEQKEKVKKKKRKR